MRHLARLRILLCLIGALFVGSVALATTLLRPSQLPELVAESTRAAHVEVIDVRYRYDERRLHSTYFTLRVLDKLYGPELPAADSEFTIKVYGARGPVEDGSRMLIPGSLQLERGHRYLLLLLPDSDWQFTSTAGSLQGVFEISTDDLGRSQARTNAPQHNLFGKQGLAQWLTAPTPTERALLARKNGPVPYDLLRRAVIQLKSSDLP